MASFSTSFSPKENLNVDGALANLSPSNTSFSSSFLKRPGSLTDSRMAFTSTQTVSISIIDLLNRVFWVTFLGHESLRYLTLPVASFHREASRSKQLVKVGT